MGQAEGITTKTVTGADTITITSTDNIYGLTITVPLYSTDSVEITGLEKTLNSTDGKVEDGIILAPGEEYIFPDKNRVIKYLYIVVRDRARLIPTYITTR